ncbi:MAG: VCBS repeat-containing protein [Deltaproteobacteria bacterium]|nr:VCBS repeat-containing protein [Deltaproteobacteria bacterium]MBI3389037.1 VCBS repeat-containing protein [Deltaproteobacteria bacterium]
MKIRRAVSQSCVTLLAALLITAIVPTVVAAGPLRFQQARPFQQLELPLPLGHPALAIAKLNSDIFLDVVVVHSEGVIVYFGDGTGQFRAAGPFSTGGSGANAVATADFDGDGKIDIAAVTDDDVVAVLLNDGNGGFTGPTFFGLGGSIGPLALVATKIDRGDDIDLAVLSTDETVYLLRGLGDGTFEPFAMPTLQTNASGAAAIAVGDFNGDGNQDLVVADEISNGVSVLLATSAGDGTFGTSRFYSTEGSAAGGGGGAGAVAVGLLDPNSSPDLLVANTAADVQQGVAILLGQRNGIFQSKQFFDNPQKSPNDIAIADVDGDGILDSIVTTSTDSTLGINLGNGDGTFGDLQQASNDIIPGNGQAQLALGDLDNNGLPDIVVLVNDTESGDRLFVTMNRSNDPTPTEAPTTAMSITASLAPTPTPTPTRPPTPTGTPTLIPTAPYSMCTFNDGAKYGDLFAIASGDFDLDGTPDLAVADTETVDGTQKGRVRIMLVNAQRLRAPELPPTECPPGFTLDSPLGDQAYDVGGTPSALAVGDLSVDGAPDVAVAVGDSIVILQNNHDGTFEIKPSMAAGAQPVAVALSDVDRNGRLDIVVALKGASQVVIFYGQSDGSYTKNTVEVGRFAEGLVVRDLNNDGRPDLAVLSTVRDVVVLLQTAPPTPSGSSVVHFQTLSAIPLTGDSTAISCDDFDRNGVLDFGITLADGQLVLIGGQLHSGVLTYSELSRSFTRNDPRALADSDFNRDGQVDLVTANTADGSLSFFYNNNGQLPAALDPFTVGAGPVSVVANDFDDDGIPDVATANSADQSITILRSSRPLFTPTPTITLTPTITPTPTISGTPTITGLATATFTPGTTGPTTRPTRTLTGTPTFTPTSLRPFGIQGGSCAIAATSSPHDWSALAALGMAWLIRRRGTRGQRGAL